MMKGAYGADMNPLDAIFEDLRRLPAPKLAEAAVLIHRLTETNRVEHLKILQETSGVWSGAEGETIERAIEEGCEKVDAPRLVRFCSIPQSWLRICAG